MKLASAEKIERSVRRAEKMARRLCGNVEDAEDLLQDTAVKVFKRLGHIEDVTAQSYVFQAVAKTHLDTLRNRGRRVLTHQLEDSLLDVRGHDLDIERAAVADGYVVYLLSLLPEGQRVAMSLKLDGYTIKEASELLGIERHAYSRRLSRATARLRAIYMEENHG